MSCLFPAVVATRKSKRMDTRNNKPIAILTALYSEAEVFLDALDDKKILKQFGSLYATGTLHGVPAVVCVGGEGRAASAAAAQTLCCLYHPRALIFSGIAGSISPRLEVGDIILCRSLLYMETNTKVIAECDPWQARFSSAPQLVDLARAVADAQGYARIPSLEEDAAAGRDVDTVRPEGAAPRYMIGTITTSDQFNTDPQVLAHTRRDLHGDGEEMEGASAAHISAKNRVPFLAIRSISNPCGQSPQQLEAQQDTMRSTAHAAAHLGLGVIAELAHRPDDWLEPAAVGTPGPDAYTF